MLRSHEHGQEAVQPYGPEEGYHFSQDLVDQALQTIRDQKLHYVDNFLGMKGTVQL